MLSSNMFRSTIFLGLFLILSVNGSLKETSVGRNERGFISDIINGMIKPIIEQINNFSPIALDIGSHSIDFPAIALLYNISGTLGITEGTLNIGNHFVNVTCVDDPEPVLGSIFLFDFLADLGDASLELKYNNRFDLGGIQNITNSGIINIYLDGLDIKGNLHTMVDILPNLKIAVTKAKTQYTVNNVTFELTGILNDEHVSEALSDLLSKYTAPLLNLVSGLLCGIIDTIIESLFPPK